MTLRKKMVLMAGLIGCGIFLAEAVFAYFDKSVSLLNAFFFLLSFTILVILFSYRMVIQRIEKLSREMTNVQDQNLSKISEVGNDEITDIATQVNLILFTNEALKQHIPQNLTTASDTEFYIYDNKNNTFSRFAHYDKYISLPNRVLFNEILNKSISYAKRHKKILAILLIDLIPKIANVSVNYHLEESIVKKLGERLSQTLRNEDILSKLDGNEFIVLLTDINKAKFASAVAEKLLKVCSAGIEIDDNNKIDLQTTIGICVYPNDGVSLEQLVENAYQSLYKAKQKKESTYQFYSDDLDIEAREYIQFEADLQRAIKNKELTLYYQPKMNLKTSQIVGVEALIRWIHPTLGIVTPDKFLPMAEDTGFIIKIGEWALREACMTNKFWQEDGYEHIAVSLNLSPKQFYHPDLLPMVQRTLQETKLNPRYLELELSEATVMMGDLEKTEKILQNLREIGVQISMDHFGTGYTSISHLKRFPITIVKIDQTYIKGIPNNQTDTAIASAMIALGHHLGMQVVAEGVETAEQLQFLSAEQCDVVQGYFLSYPVPAFTVSEQFKKLTDKVLI